MMRMLMTLMMDAFRHIRDRVGEGGGGGAMMTTLLRKHPGQSPEEPFYPVFAVLS